MEDLPNGELYPEVREFVRTLMEQRIEGKKIAHALAYISTEFALHCAADPLEACSEILAAIHTATDHYRNLISVDVDDADDDESGGEETAGPVSGEGTVH